MQRERERETESDRERVSKKQTVRVKDRTTE